MKMSTTWVEDILSKLETTEVKPKPTKPPQFDDYAEVPVKDHEVISIIQPNMQHGPWIAGGAALAWYNNEAMVGTDGDIDVFCSSYEQLQDVASRLNSKGKHLIQRYSSQQAVTYDFEGHHGDWVVQLIKCRYMQSPQEIIDSFDISVCEVVTDGMQFALGQNTAYDIKHRLLRFKDELRPDAIKRYAKYYSYGYKPVDGLFERVISNPQGQKTFNADEDYHNVF